MQSAPPHVRPATPADAAAIAAIQVRSWLTGYPGLKGEIEAFDTDSLTETWREALTEPGVHGGHRAAFVAIGEEMVVGFATLDGGELLALEVNPLHRRRGHGSRLLAAVADQARAHRAGHLGCWCPVPDEARRNFLQSAGFQPDQGLRTLTTASGDTVSEAHLSAGLDEPA